MSDDLKIGDIIEVNFLGDEWIERIFVKYAMDGGVCYVEGDDENSFKTGGSFKVHAHFKWRKKQEPKYIPFTYDDWRELIGKAVIIHCGLSVCMIDNVSSNDVQILSYKYTYDELLRLFTFADTGKPCGKEVKE